jgi:transcriptional regulator with XRE-family HTH domain
MEPDVQRFGERVREIRIERRISVDGFANMLGMSVSMVRMIERGASPPSFINVIAIAQALKVDAFYLFVYPHLNPLHDLVELTRRANKATTVAMKASCEGLLTGLKMQRQAER